MQSSFVKPNDPVLSKIAELIDKEKIPSKSVKDLVNKMLNTAYGKQKDRKKPLLVGLAAPQIGISKRIILVDVKANGRGKVGNLRVFINPKIVWKSKETYERYEGCWSTGRVCGIVERPVSVKIAAFDLQGKQTKKKYSGYTARIFQHEIDHLNGKEFVTHIKDDDKLHWVEPKEFPEYRNKESWRNWTKKCSRDKWKKIKAY